MHRRKLLQASGMAAALLGAPASAATTAPLPLPEEKLREKDPEKYWKRIRDEQFLLPNWRAFLNNGSLGITPRPVLKTVADFLYSSAALEMDWYPRWGYETLDEHRKELAEFYGCKADELAFTHNATEAMSMIAAGIDLKEGDEVLLTNLEHPSGRGCWYTRAARHKITVREVALPMPPKSPAEVADLLTSAISPRTRVISFSGILSPTGWILPVADICRFARSKGVISVVDAAHMHGQVPIRISDFQCDYMAASPHKWAYAPAGSGMLYVREENLEKLWPTIISGSWDKNDLKAARFMNVGTNNRAIVEGAMAGLRFLKSLGPEHVYARTHHLARYVIQRAKECPHIEVMTPDDDRMFGSLVCLKFKTAKLEKLSKLISDRRIWVATSQQLRVSTHIHTRPQDVDLYFETIRTVLG